VPQLDFNKEIFIPRMHGTNIKIILPAALWPWARLSLWQKWVPGIFPSG